MTKEDIELVAKIMLTADCFCSNCASDLIEKLQETFPEFKETIQAVYDKMEVYEELWRKAEYLHHNESGPKPSMRDIRL
jgi:hypothetical protein